MAEEVKKVTKSLHLGGCDIMETQLASDSDEESDEGKKGAMR